MIHMTNLYLDKLLSIRKFTHIANIMHDAFEPLLFSKLFRHNMPKPSFITEIIISHFYTILELIIHSVSIPSLCKLIVLSYRGQLDKGCQYYVPIIFLIEMEGRHESGLVVSCFYRHFFYKANINFIAKICGNIMNMIEILGGCAPQVSH